MRFKHTEKTAAIYNAMIRDYREISCDSDLEKIGIEYEEYRSSETGLFLDRLRFDGWATTSFENVAKWAENRGCHVVKVGESDWKVKLQEAQE